MTKTESAALEDPTREQGPQDPSTEEEPTRALQADWLFARLPEWVIDTLSSEQKEAIHQAAMDPSWKSPPINIRFSIPVPGRRYYLTVVGGESRRSADRRARERGRYPLRTAANIFFFLGLAAVIYVIVLIGISIRGAFG
ncbi:MAG: hypothetical protein V3R66_07500 [Rhodospirillales bacterium]